MRCALFTFLKKNIAGTYFSDIDLNFNTLTSFVLTGYLWAFADMKDM